MNNIYQWFFFFFFSLGATGGLIYITDKFTRAVQQYRRARRDAAAYDPYDYEPWDGTDGREEPVLGANNIEPPISARTK